MAQSTARYYSAGQNSDKTQDLQDRASQTGDTISNEARNLVDRVVAYTKANPVEAAAIAGGVAFVASAAIMGPRLLQSRRERDFDRLVRRAYREADRIRDDSSSTWSRLTEWVANNVPSPNPRR
jgi:cell division septum initiation protein DivIVA